MGDVMVSGGSTAYGRQAYSNVTLALARDSGWYIPNMAAAGLQRFGSQSGCDILVRACCVLRCLLGLDVAFTDSAARRHTCACVSAVSCSAAQPLFPQLTLAACADRSVRRRWRRLLLLHRGQKRHQRGNSKRMLWRHFTSVLHRD